MQTLTVEQLKEMQSQKEDCLLINTLDEKTFFATRIPGSINIPQSRPDFAERVQQQAGRKDRKIVVYCVNESCQASPKAAYKLEQAGFSNVYDFEAGAQGWHQAGDKLVLA